MNSFWSPAGTQAHSNSGTGKFDAFSSFFPSSSEPAKKQNSTTSDMYEEFFSDKPSKPVEATSKPQGSAQINLLDL